MAIEIQSELMPKSNKGRKPVPLNEELVEGLTKLLAESKPVEVDDYLVPQMFGPSWVYEKDFQATAKGRKYAEAVKEKIGKKVSVRPVEINPEGTPKDSLEKDEKGKVLKGYRFRLYIPLSEFKVETEESGES